MNWKYKTLDELGFVGRGRSRHRPRGDEKLYGGKYPFIQTGDVQKAEFYITDYNKTYSDFGYAQSKLWNKGTLCISIVGANTAESAILNIDACFPDSVIGFIADEKVSNTTFVKYYLDTIKIQMKTISEGAARENLSMDKLLSLKMLIPNLPTQKKIASILSAYDDLIENNNQRITLLEEMAEEIYKEWFVRFRFPNYKNTKFIDKDGKEVAHGTKDAFPEGWEKVKFDNYIDFEKGVEPGSKNYKSECLDKNYVPFLRVGDLGSRDSNIFINKELCKEKYVTKDDILITLDGTVGKVAMGLEGCYSSGLRKIVYKTEIIKRSFTYFSLLSSNIQGTIQAHAAGTTILHASSSIKFMKIILPKEYLLQSFENIVNPMLDEVLVLKNKNQILQETRDLLLPRLISGKLSVEELEIDKVVLNMAAEPQEKYN